jgi:hypothetical protein
MSGLKSSLWLDILHVSMKVNMVGSNCRSNLRTDPFVTPEMWRPGMSLCGC